MILLIDTTDKKNDSDLGTYVLDLPFVPRKDDLIDLYELLEAEGKLGTDEEVNQRIYELEFVVEFVVWTYSKEYGTHVKVFCDGE